MYKATCLIKRICPFVIKGIFISHQIATSRNHTKAWISLSGLFWYLNGCSEMICGNIQNVIRLSYVATTRILMFCSSYDVNYLAVCYGLIYYSYLRVNYYENSYVLPYYIQRKFKEPYSI